MASSLLKKGKQFVQDVNAMLAAPDNSQAPQAPPQPYTSFSPSAGLSSYFQQQSSASSGQTTYVGSSPYRQSAQSTSGYIDPQYQQQFMNYTQPHPSPSPAPGLAQSQIPPFIGQSSVGIAPPPASSPAATLAPTLAPPATPILSPPSPAPPTAWPSSQNNQASQSQWFAPPPVQSGPSRPSTPYTQTYPPPPPQTAPPLVTQSQYQRPSPPQHTQSAPNGAYDTYSTPIRSTTEPRTQPINYAQNTYSQWPVPPSSNSQPQSFDMSSISLEVASINQSMAPSVPSEPPNHFPPPPMHLTSAQPGSLHSPPIHSTSIQSTHIQPAHVHSPVQPTPVQSTPVQSMPMQPAPIQPTPIQSAPVQSAPVQPTPVQSTPAQSIPMQSAPMLLTSAQSTSMQYTISPPPVSAVSPGNVATSAYQAASPYGLATFAQDNQLSPLAPQSQYQLVRQPESQQLTQSGNLYSGSSEIAKATVPTQRPRGQSRAEPAPSVLRVHTGSDPATARKILCLDGGGVRGLASLMIVKHLMDRLERQRGGRLEPWQEFDMIAGTSTGGLIAIMLGRLRMSVDDCIEAYQRLSRKIFTPVHSKSNVAGRAVAKFKAEGKFESEPLEEIVKQMCQEYLLSDSELMRDDEEDAPKVFVCAVQGSNSDSIVIRSYRNGTGEWDELYPMCKIWEAARATSAASTFFDPIRIGHQRYVDGALRYNNPIEKADEESTGLWPNEDRVIISIGTGCAPGPKLLGNAVKLIETLAKIVTDSEEENLRFRKRNRAMIDNSRLYRFNVLHGLADVKLDEWEALEDISAHTSTYLRSPDTAREFEKCATTLKDVGQRLGYIAGEELQVHRKIQELSTVYCEFCEDCHKGISYNDKMFFCVDCQMFNCSDCYDCHESAHIRYMLRFEFVQWMPKLPGIKSSASCHYCAKESKTRWECTTCGQALCRTCAWDFKRRIEFFTEHQQSDSNGRYFSAVYPPFWSTSSQWVTESCPCVDMELSAHIHCERCHKLFTLADRGYWCRTCRVEFGGGQCVCQECFEQIEEHRTKHQFGTLEFASESTGIEELQEATQMVWGCTQCSERFAEGRQHLHKHFHLKLFISPILAEMLRRINFQLCHRKEARSSKKVQTDPAPISCDMCGTALAFEQVGSMCLQPGCGSSFCASCTMTKKTWHRHYMYEFVIKRSPANFMAQVNCSYCFTPYICAMAQGLWCADCNRHFMCFVCVLKAVDPAAQAVPEGLPHQKILKQCKVKNGWILYLSS